MHNSIIGLFYYYYYGCADMVKVHVVGVFYLLVICFKYKIQIYG